MIKAIGVSFKENGKVCSSLIGLVSLRNKKIRVIPLKSKYVPKKGDVVIVEFKQKIPITAGKYTLSFSCTKYNLKGELEVLNRKYDALLIDAITTKNGVGLVRLNSEITLKKN